MLADLPASPEDAVRIVPAPGPVAGLRHAPHRGRSEKIDQAQRAQDRDHGERKMMLLPACDGRSEEHVSPVFPHEPRKGPFLSSRRAMTVLPVVTAPWLSAQRKSGITVRPGVRWESGFSSSVLSYLVTNHSITFEPESCVYRMQNTTYINSF